MAKLRWISDSGHGWLEVPTKAVLDAGVVPSKYSYTSDDRRMTYLEEDCDARAYLWEVGSDDDDIPEEYIDGDCWVRGLDRCSDAQKTGKKKTNEKRRNWMVDNHELLVGKLYVILDKAMEEYENPEDCAQDFREYTNAWLASRTNSRK